MKLRPYNEQKRPQDGQKNRVKILQVKRRPRLNKEGWGKKKTLGWSLGRSSRTEEALRLDRRTPRLQKKPSNKRTKRRCELKAPG